jgi:hypothetical protein
VHDLQVRPTDIYDGISTLSESTAIWTIAFCKEAGKVFLRLNAFE